MDKYLNFCMLFLIVLLAKLYLVTVFSNVKSGSICLMKNHSKILEKMKNEKIDLENSNIQTGF